MRGVPRALRAISRAPSGWAATPSFSALRATMYSSFLDRVELQPGRDAEAVAQRRCQKPEPGGGTHQREGLQLDPDGAGRRALADYEIELEILKRGVEHLFDDRIETVDLVDEEYIARFEIGQDRREIARLGQHRAGGHAEIDAELARHDLRERRLAEAGRAVKERVVHRLAPRPGRLQEDAQICPRLGLAHEIVEHLRAQRAVAFLGAGLGAQEGVGLGHGFGARSLSAARMSVLVSASGVSDAAWATALAASPGL